LLLSFEADRFKTCFFSGKQTASFLESGPLVRLNFSLESRPFSRLAALFGFFTGPAHQQKGLLKISFLTIFEASF
jgi:hypothetical protein